MADLQAFRHVVEFKDRRVSIGDGGVHVGLGFDLLGFLSDDFADHRNTLARRRWNGVPADGSVSRRNSRQLPARGAAGDVLIIDTRLLAVDERRLVLFHEMTCSRFETQVASNEVLCVHVDLETRRPASWPADAAERLARGLAAQSHLPRPKLAGRSIRLAGSYISSAS